MIKHNNCVYIVPLYPILNPEQTRQFASFSKEDSANLYSSLFFNLKEITEQISELTTSVFCFDEKDKEFLQNDYSNQQLVFSNTGNLNSLFKVLSEKFFGSFSNNLIIFVNTIKISNTEILKYLDLLNREDESFLIGKSQKSKVSHIGFNVYNQELFHQVETTDLKFENFLHLVCRYDYFLNIMNDSLFIEDINDFKVLYKELSKKESLRYCSQNIHEKFTHLFIEYKELL